MPRILLIDDDERYRRLLRHHFSILIAEAEIVEHVPSRDGRPARRITGAGYDFVVFGAPTGSHSGLSWLKDMTGRPNFPPVIYLAESTRPTRSPTSSGAAHWVSCPRPRSTRRG